MKTLKNILEFLEKSVEAYPEKYAFCDDRTDLTYMQLMLQAKAVGTFLLKYNVSKNPVAILLDKTVTSISAFMGVVYSGGIYVVLDAHMPTGRMSSILQTLSPAAILTDHAHEGKAREVCTCAPILLMEDACACQCDEEQLSKIRRLSIDTDPVYILFTSGSTGNPKGTVVSHRSIIAYTEWVVETFQLNKDTVFGNQTPFFFSMSVLDIFSTLCSSATMYIIPSSLFSFPLKLIEALHIHQVNTIYWVPSALSIISNCQAFDYAAPPSMKTVLFAGEVMPAKVLNYWAEHLPEAMLANLYGPTEVTDICTCYIVNRTFANYESIPIGKACGNCDVLLITPDGREAGLGEEGEIYVRGSFLSMGYYNDPEKTAEVFVQNPLNRHYPELVYRTGDLAKYNEYGELQYIARRDMQIKHMGYRIELGEIDAAACAVNGVECCAALYDPQTDQILLFYQGSSVDEAALTKELRTRLPKYMLPANLIRLRQMPYNQNGKIDRAALKKEYQCTIKEVSTHG